MDKTIARNDNIQAFVNGELAPKEARAVRLFIAENLHASVTFRELLIEKKVSEMRAA